MEVNKKKGEVLVLAFPIRLHELEAVRTSLLEIENPFVFKFVANW